MNLSGLLSAIEEEPGFRALVASLSAPSASGGQRRVVVIEAVHPYLVAALWRALQAPILWLTPRSDRAKALPEQLTTWLGESASGGPIHLFPEADALPYERLTPDPYTVHQRITVLHHLQGAAPDQVPPLVVASAQALMPKLMSHQEFRRLSQEINMGQLLRLDEALPRWFQMGYQRTDLVEVPGDLSVRGGIVDIFSPGSALPLRLELVGDRVESLRLFQPETQRSVHLVSAATVVPATEVVTPNLDAEETRLRAGLVNQSSLLEYFPPEALMIVEDASGVQATVEGLDAQAAETKAALAEREGVPPDLPQPYWTWPELAQTLKRSPRQILLDAWGSENEDPLTSFVPAPSYAGRLRLMLNQVPKFLAMGSRLVVVSQQASRLSELFLEHGTVATPQSEVAALPPQGSLTLVQGSLPEGWGQKLASNGTWAEELGAYPLSLLLLTDAEVFGFSKQRRMVRRRGVSYGRPPLELTPGDYVVHVEHGIGRFAGVRRMTIADVEREYLVLEYAEGDKLYVPNDQIDRVSHYIGPGNHQPALSRLGTQEWTRLKQRVKQAVAHIAEELLALYSARQVVEGFAFSPDTVWQRELEASFPYMETPDQLQAVMEVKEAMERPKPMDHLVCGDVGYGKTEVALRAAFKAVMDGMQVAVLVPTTVLAQQHRATFNERLSSFPVKMEVLSRFRSGREQRGVLRGLEEGRVDICIGTHRLLQKDVAFKRLGLVIIDEEQRFGVVHKERLKQMRKEVDVLTLTATPIPRTLHMSLVGVRDMSTMETPPEERLPIKTYVSEYDERLIREAVLRELDRGGQVFFVHNRVQNIGRVAQRLQEVLPEARLAVAHGQMPEEQLEAVMLDFTAGKSDVLVCTTIIESGLDIPNVNTLIVNQADRLGLAQLYQLRGRVGRGANRAYAYFLFNKGQRLTEAAGKRLKTIFEATELGAGFQIAMKDLEIRGAGNLLGVEQSGHIGAVGFDLYCQLLTEAVEELKARGPIEGGEERASALTKAEPPISLDLPLPAYIPEYYVDDLNTRLNLYQKLAQVARVEEVEEFTQELWDRFGRTPQEVENLLYAVKLKALAQRAGVQHIGREDGHLVVQLHPAKSLAPGLLAKGLLPPGIRLGHSQIRLNLRQLGNRWPQVLEDLIQRMGAEAG